MVIQQIPVISGVSAATLVLLIMCIVTLFVVLLLKSLKKKTDNGMEKAQYFGDEEKANCTLSIPVGEKVKAEINEYVTSIIKKHEASKSISLSEMSRTFAGGLAHTLYSGLKHPNHGQIIDEIVTTIRSLAEAESDHEK